MKKKMVVLILAVVFCFFGMTACAGGGKSISDMWNDLWGKGTEDTYKPLPHEPTPNPDDNNPDVVAEQFYEVRENVSSTAVTWNLRTSPIKAMSTNVGGSATMTIKLEEAITSGVLYLRSVYGTTDLSLAFTLTRFSKYISNPLSILDNWSSPLAKFTNASTKTVESIEKLYVGMLVDIYSAAGTLITPNVKIATISQETNQITFEGSTGTLTNNSCLWLPHVYEQTITEIPAEVELNFTKPLPRLVYGKGYKFTYDGNFNIDWEEI